MATRFASCSGSAPPPRPSPQRGMPRQGISSPSGTRRLRGSPRCRSGREPGFSAVKSCAPAPAMPPGPW
jgi:hypothetical protein